MWRALRGLATALTAVLTAVPVLAASESDLRILTYPIGLVSGEIPIDIDLGPGAEEAELYLDGEFVCALGGSSTNCTYTTHSKSNSHGST